MSTTLDSNLEHSYHLQTGIESICNDITQSLNLAQLVQGIADYKVSKGLEDSNDSLLLEVADYAIRNTDLEQSDVLKTGIEASSIIGLAISKSYSLVTDLIRKFKEWILSMVTEHKVLQDKFERTLVKLDTLNDLPAGDLPSFNMSSSILQIMQIDYKVINDKKKLLVEYARISKFINGLIYKYGQSLVELATILNTQAQSIPTTNDIEGVVLRSNVAISRFLTKAEILAPTNVADGTRVSGQFIGNREFSINGISSELLDNLKSSDPHTDRIKSVNFRFVDRSSDKYQIVGKHTIDAFSQSEARDFLKSSILILKDINHYYDTMESNLGVQLKSLERGTATLDKVEAELRKDKVKLDGKQSITEAEATRAAYAYQSVAWRWGVGPIPPAIGYFTRISRILLGHCVQSMNQMEPKEGK